VFAVIFSRLPLLLTVVLTVDKLDQMLGSYGPNKTGEPYTKNFEPDESPSGMLARTGTYNVRSRVTDDDGTVYIGTCAMLCLCAFMFTEQTRVSFWS
jgi:hypothetical protein